MKEHELTTLLERAGDGLSPDVDALVDGGAARGRRSLRRRRLTSGLSAVAAIGIIAAGVSLWPAGESPTVVDDPDLAAAAPPAADRELAEPDVIRDRLVDALPAGDVSDVAITDEDPDQDRWPSRRITISLRLNDADVEAEIVDTTAEDPASVSDPGTRPDGCTDAILTQRIFSDAEMQNPTIRSCSRWKTEKETFNCAQDPECWVERNAPHCTRPDHFVTCTELPDGSWVSTSNFETDEDLDELMTWADVETTDHWWIRLRATESGDPDTEMPLLDHDTLTDLVTSDIWFE